MYSGIIYEAGTIYEIKEMPYGKQIKIKSPLFAYKQIGDSFAVDGVCLTQSGWQDQISTFDVTCETLSKTTINDYAANQKVHLEKPLQAQDEIGGHFVQGHVDGTATLVGISPNKLVVELKDDQVRYAILKGSIAIDGVSLTIANINGNCVEIALIPHTYEMTLFKEKKVDSKVNVEVDMFSKMIFKHLSQMEIKKAVL